MKDKSKKNKSKKDKKATAQKDLAQARMALLMQGFSAEQVERFLNKHGDRSRSLRELFEEGMVHMRKDKPASVKTWGPYLSLLVDGLPAVCPCVCLACVGNDGCPCGPGVDGHHSKCQMPKDNPYLDCAARFTGLGDRPADQVRKRDIEDAAWWAERRGKQRAVARNVKRAAAQRPLDLSDGRGAREQLIQASRWLFTYGKDNELLTDNPAGKTKIPARQVPLARSLDPEEYVQVYGCAVTTGRDPELDGLILRHLLYEAVRRHSLLELECGMLDTYEVAIKYYDRKKKQWRYRPTTATHMMDLVAHAAARGPRVAAPPDASEEVRRTGVPALTDGSPVFYRKPVDTHDAHGYFVSRQTHPISRKHFETLFARIRRHLPWTEQRQLRPHDIRHTSARIMFKAADDQMAKLHLAHDGGSTTDHYLREHLEQLRKLKELLFEPPAAEPDEPDGEHGDGPGLDPDSHR